MFLAALQTVPGSEGRIAEVARTFGVDWTHLAAQSVSFAIVCAVLYALAYKPVLRILAARRQQIAAGLANAEKIKAELDRIEAQRVGILEKAGAEGKLLVDDARAAAARVRAQETAKALAEAEQILVRARDEARRDHARMLGELRREVGHLVIQTTAAVTGRILTTDDHQRIAEETARQLAS
jgi:F-type H+-transporting ATPase subunit b